RRREVCLLLRNQLLPGVVGIPALHPTALRPTVRRVDVVLQPALPDGMARGVEGTLDDGPRPLRAARRSDSGEPAVLRQPRDAAHRPVPGVEVGMALRTLRRLDLID